MDAILSFQVSVDEKDSSIAYSFALRKLASSSSSYSSYLKDPLFKVWRLLFTYVASKLIHFLPDVLLEGNLVLYTLYTVCMYVILHT